MQAFRDPGVKNIAGLLEGAERVGVHHLRPHVAVVAGGIVVAGEDVAELLGPVAQLDFLRHADALKHLRLEGMDVAGVSRRRSETRGR